jgi:hypothetical protein
MSLRVAWMILLLGLLPACDGNPFEASGIDAGDDDDDDGGGIGGGDDDDDDDGDGVPDVVQQNLTAADLANWTNGAASIRINLYSQDASDLNAEYLRNAAFDVPGYQAYTYQETTSNRYAVALVREVDGVRAVTAVDAGQFANYFGGGFFTRVDSFDVPAGGGLFNYSGTYAGLLNAGPTLVGPGGDLDPERAYRTTGRTLITADFTNMAISGGIDTRRIVDLNQGLPTIALFSTDITTDGSFEGAVYRLDPDGWVEAGDYAGVFAGLDADAIATLLLFNPIQGEDELVEHGVIVLENCDIAGGPACP